MSKRTWVRFGGSQRQAVNLMAQVVGVVASSAQMAPTATTGHSTLGRATSSGRLALAQPLTDIPSPTKRRVGNLLPCQLRSGMS